MLGGKKSYPQRIKIIIFLKIKILKINLVREEDSVLLSEVTNKIINLLPYKYTARFVYMCMHAHLCVENTSVYRCVCVCCIFRGHRLILGLFLYHFSPYVSRQHFPQCMGLANLSKLALPWAPRILLNLSSSSEITISHPGVHAWAALIHRVVSPALAFPILIAKL